MKKYLVSAGLFLSVVALAASSFTTHYQLEKPQDGDVNWGNSYRSNMNEIDEQMFINMSSVTAHIASVTAHAAANITALAGTECPSATNVQEFLDCLDAAATNTVHLTGDETITGNKTFTGNNNFTGSNQFTSLNTLSGQLQLAGTGRVTFAANALHETKNRAVVTDSLGSVTTMNDISDENVQQLAGVTGNIQDQINNIINGGSGAPYVLRTGDSMSGALNIQGATMQVTGSGVNKAFTITAPASVTGGVRVVTEGATAYFGTPGRTVIGSIPQGAVLVTQDDGGIDVPYVEASVTTADELAFLSGVGGLANGYPLTKNGAGNVGIIPVSSAEIYSLVGVTANVQSQLNALAAATVDVSAFVAKVGSTMTGPLIMSGATANIELTSTAELILNRGGGGNNKIRSTAGGTPDLEILAGNSLGMTIPYGTGAVDVPRGLSSTTVNVSGLTASRLVRTNGSKELVSVTAAVTDQELGYLVGVTAPIQAQLASVSVDVSGLVQKSGDTMTGGLGTTALRVPFGVAPGTILYGNDTDTGPYSTGDGEYTIAANGFDRLHISQNFTEILGPATVTGNFAVLGTFSLPPGSVDLASSVVTGILPMANGGTGSSGLPQGAIPYVNGSNIYDSDYNALNFNPSDRRTNFYNTFTSGDYGVGNLAIGGAGGTVVSTQSNATFNYGTIGHAISGSYQYVSGPANQQQLNGVTSDLVIGSSIAFNISSASRIDLMKVDEVAVNLSTDSFVQDAQYRTTTPSLRGTIRNLVLDKVGPNVTPGELQEITGAVYGRQTFLSGITSSTAIVGAQYNVSNSVVTAPFTRALAAAYEGPIQGVANVIHQPGNPNGVDQVSLLVANMTVNDPSSTSIIGLSTPLNISINQNISGTGLGFGAVSTAYVGLLGITSGVTTEAVGGNVAAVVNTFTGAGGTGGHATRVFGYRAKGVIPGGGSNTFGDAAGFWQANGDCAGISPCYSLAAEDASATLYSAGPLKLGLTPNTVPYLDGSTTVVSSAVTPTELGYLSGATANIQGQINNITVGGAFVAKAGDTMTGKLAVINNQNGGLEIQTPSGSAGFLINRTGSSSGSFYLGTAGDRDGASTYDELQFRKGNGTSTAFTMRGYDSGVQQLLFGTSNDAYISRTGTSELGFYTAGGLRGGFYSDGTFRLYGGTSGYVGFQASSSTTSYNLTLPAVQGATNSVMENNGSGNLSWREWKPPSVTSYTTAGSNLYTVPSGARYITINMVGAGGGGGPSSNVALGSVGGSSVIIGVATATGGGAGPWGLTGATGGVSTVATSGTILDCGSTNGGYGNPGEELLLTDYGVGGNGGSSYYGGAGGGGGPVSNGQTAATASGSGGGGAGVGGPGKSGAGGGAGGYVCATVTSLSATYPVTVGAAGGGASGAGNGGSGKVVITEYYQ